MNFRVSILMGALLVLISLIGYWTVSQTNASISVTVPPQDKPIHIYPSSVDKPSGHLASEKNYSSVLDKTQVEGSTTTLYQQSTNKVNGIPTPVPVIRRILYTDGKPSDYSVMDHKLYLTLDSILTKVNAEVGDDLGLVDPDTFMAISSSHYGFFFKDETHVFVSDFQSFGMVPNADPLTFQVFSASFGTSTQYGGDNENVFDLTKRIEGADPKSFRIENSDGPFTMDATYVWCNYTGIGDKLVLNANGHDFIPIGKSYFGKSNSQVFCCDGSYAGPLVGVEIATFTIDNDFLAHDAKRSYLGCENRN